MKGGQSPVSEADFAVDTLLARHPDRARGRTMAGCRKKPPTRRPTCRSPHLRRRPDRRHPRLPRRQEHLSYRWRWSRGGAPLVGVLECPARAETYQAELGWAPLRRVTAARLRPPARPSPMPAEPRSPPRRRAARRLHGRSPTSRRSPTAWRWWHPARSTPPTPSPAPRTGTLPLPTRRGRRRSLSSTATEGSCAAAGPHLTPVRRGRPWPNVAGHGRG